MIILFQSFGTDKIASSSTSPLAHRERRTMLKTKLTFIGGLYQPHPPFQTQPIYYYKRCYNTRRIIYQYCPLPPPHLPSPTPHPPPPTFRVQGCPLPPPHPPPPTSHRPPQPPIPIPQPPLPTHLCYGSVLPLVLLFAVFFGIFGFFGRFFVFRSLTLLVFAAALFLAAAAVAQGLEATACHIIPRSQKPRLLSQKASYAVAISIWPE